MVPGGIVFTQKSHEQRNKDNRPYESNIFFSDIAFLAWREYIYELTGINYLDNKKEILSKRLQRRMAVLGFNSFEKYLNYARNKSNRENFFVMEAVSNSETRFFRHSSQLDTMILALLKELKPENQTNEEKTFRIWSAGCSTGEEAYSIAMLLKEHILNKFPPVKVEIVATDINVAGLDFALEGSYDKLAVTGIPKTFLEKYFNISRNRYDVIPEIKKLVKFKYYNLTDLTIPQEDNKFDLIYCANVLMYFDEKSRDKALSNLYYSMVNRGKLFIGYSETLYGLREDFLPQKKYGGIFYLK